MTADQPTDSIETTLNYMKKTGNGVLFFDSFRPHDIENGELDPTAVNIYNARAGHLPQLETEGFTLAEHRYAPVDFDNQDEVRRVYYPEVAALAKHIAGATYAIAFEHRVRNSNLPKIPASYDPSGAQKYHMENMQRGRLSSFTYVHGDYIGTQAPAAAKNLLRTVGEPFSRLDTQYTFINAWHPITTAVEKDPLALCDAQTMQVEDAIPTRVRGPKEYPSLYTFKKNTAHKWLYFPRMTPDETLFFKHFDSKTSQVVAHSSFIDPTSPADAPARQSIEVRILLCFGKPTPWWRSLFLSKQ